MGSPAKAVGFQQVCELDLEGVVAKRLPDPYGSDPTWLKVLNRSYSQKEGRAELLPSLIEGLQLVSSPSIRLSSASSSAKRICASATRNLACSLISRHSLQARAARSRSFVPSSRLAPGTRLERCTVKNSTTGNHE